jgi:hypothetical protein
MGIPDGAHTHGHGGSGLGGLVVILLAVALLGPAVAAAVAELLHLLVIAAVAVAAVAGVGLVAAGGWRLRSGRQDMARVVSGHPRHTQAVSVALRLAARDRGAPPAAPAPAWRLGRGRRRYHRAPPPRWPVTADRRTG